MKNAGETLLQLRIMFIFVANVGPNMNKKLFFLLLFLSTANLISCNKNNPDKDTDNGDTSLWVALHDGEDGSSEFEFKDDKCYIYRDGNLQYTCPFLSAVVRKGTDIYALAHGESKAGKYSIWKNGKRLYGLDSEGGFPLDYAGACGLCVVNNDVYSCGTDAVFDSGRKLKSYKGRVWKNEKPILELESRGSVIWPYRILVEGNDIYVAGALYDPANKEKYSAVWKNGKLFFLGKGSGWDMINDIRSYYGSLYYAGNQCDEGGGGPDARIWKNNTVLYDLTGGCVWAPVYDMAFKGSDLYAVGYRCRRTGGHVIFDGAIWKNGEIMWAIEDTEQTSIAIIGDDIYTAGIVETSNGKNGTNRLAQIWKNGKVYQTFDYCQEVLLINACN